MEGFWTVQFTGVQGWGAGVVTFMAGQVFGGDSGFLYEGTYTQQGNAMNARVHVRRYVAGAPNVMGRDNFDLELTGTLQGNTIGVTGVIPGTQLRLNGTLTKQRDLPPGA
jgi:hypothetical protein